MEKCIGDYPADLQNHVKSPIRVALEILGEPEPMKGLWNDAYSTIYSAIEKWEEIDRKYFPGPKKKEAA